MVSQEAARYLAQPYARIIMPDEEGRYSAQILEFPGCFGDGDSPDQAYANLEEVAESWLESALAQDLPIPPPFASRGYSGTVSVRLPRSLHRRAAEHARRDGVSLNQLFVYAMAQIVGARDEFDAVATRIDQRLDRMQAPERITLWGMDIARTPAQGIAQVDQLAVMSEFISAALPPSEWKDVDELLGHAWWKAKAGGARSGQPARLKEGTRGKG